MNTVGNRFPCKVCRDYFYYSNLTDGKCASCSKNEPFVKTHVPWSDSTWNKRDIVVHEIRNKLQLPKTVLGKILEGKAVDEKYIKQAIEACNFLLTMADELCKPDEPEYESKDVMIYIGGSKTSYHCECGGNVFRWINKEHNKARCNSCSSVYTSEK